MFVTRSNTQLMLNGSLFRFSGCNIYWLGLMESPTRYPTQFDIDDALSTAKEMGASVVRSHTLGVSTGNSLSVWPTLGSTNATAFNTIDYSIYRAGQLGLKLIIPFTDNYQYYHGGKHNFTDWRGISDETQFYTNTQVISDFETYINVILTRVNQYSGIAYKDDPAIMAWETINEGINPLPGASWTTTIANYIKSVDSNHLVIDGSYGVYWANLSIANVDIYSQHCYPMNYSKIAGGDAGPAYQKNKAFLIGEYDWASVKPNGDTLSSFLSNIETNPEISGDLYWSLFPHNDTHGFIQHNDGYSLYYPGNTSDLQSRSQQLRAHAYTLQGLAPVPSAGIITQAPIITSITPSGSNVFIAWRGVAGAYQYIVQVAPSNTGPWATITNTATDWDTPYAYTPSGLGLWYQVAAQSYSGIAGPFSSAVQH